MNNVNKDDIGFRMSQFMNDPNLSLKNKLDMMRAELAKLDKEPSPKTWSENVAETIKAQADSQGVSSSLSSNGNKDVFTFGDEKAVITKRLVGGAVGSDDGVIRVFVNKKEYENFSWFKNAIQQHPIKLFFQDEKSS